MHSLFHFHLKMLSKHSNQQDCLTKKMDPFNHINSKEHNFRLYSFSSIALNQEPTTNNAIYNFCKTLFADQLLQHYHNSTALLIPSVIFIRLCWNCRSGYFHFTYTFVKMFDVYLFSSHKRLAFVYQNCRNLKEKGSRKHSRKKQTFPFFVNWQSATLCCCVLGALSFQQIR